MKKDDINSKLQDIGLILGDIAGTAIDKTVEIAQTASKKSKEAISVTKINLKISEEKGYIRQKYEKIGKLIYDKYESDLESTPEDIKDLIAEITVGFETIKLYESKIDEIKNNDISKDEDFDFQYDNDEITPDDIEEDICDIVSDDNFDDMSYVIESDEEIK